MKAPSDMENNDFNGFTPPFLRLHAGLEIPVLLISLDDASDRRRDLIERGVPADWIARYFPARDMRGASTEALEAAADIAAMRSLMGRDIKPGEIGCAVSHRNLALWLAQSDHDMALVVEDDIVPQGEDWLRRVGATAHALSAHARGGAAFVCLLGLVDFVAERTVKRQVVWSASSPSPDAAEVYLHSEPGGLWRTHAYLISREAARRIGSAEAEKVTRVADHWKECRRRGWVDELFFTRPVLIAQNIDVPSSIGDRSRPATSEKPASLLRRLNSVLWGSRRAIRKWFLERFLSYRI